MMISCESLNMWTFGGLQGAVWSFPRTTWTRGRTGGSYEKEQSVLHFGDIGGAHVGCADGGEVPPYQRHGMRRDALLLGGRLRPRRARGVGSVRRGRVVHLVGEPQLRRGRRRRRLHVVPRGAAARRALGRVHALLPRAGQPAARLHRDGRHAVHPDRLLSRSAARSTSRPTTIPVRPTRRSPSTSSRKASRPTSSAYSVRRPGLASPYTPTSTAAASGRGATATPATGRRAASTSS